MAGALSRPKIRVEGKNDLHSMVQLLIRHGLDYDSEPWPPEFPEFIDSESCEKLLAGMPLAVELGTDRTIGFVLDADSPLASRWEAVRGQLRKVGVDTPNAPPPGGFIGESPKYQARVGVWLMPDNQRPGTLETFLSDLVAADDPLIDHATTATTDAKQLGAKFSEPDTKKAVLHAWLAWQKRPGVPYGTAICAKYFGVDSPAAMRFVDWFKTLFAIP